MIINFYRASGTNFKNRKVSIPGLEPLNLEAVPVIGTYIVVSGQRFYVQMVELDADTAEWNIYVVRA